MNQSHTICSSLELLHLYQSLFKRRDGSNRYIHIKITGGKGCFMDTINPGGDLYTADQICSRFVEFSIDYIFVSFDDVFVVRSVGFQLERVVPPC